MNRLCANVFDSPDEHAVHLRERLLKLLDGEEWDETAAYVEDDAGDFEIG